MLILVIESIINGLITFMLGIMIFNMSINKQNKNICKPYGISFAFFITGVIIHIIIELSNINYKVDIPKVEIPKNISKIIIPKIENVEINENPLELNENNLELNENNLELNENNLELNENPLELNENPLEL
jgi:hypothetical protein